MTKLTVGQRLRLARKARGMTQTDVERKCGVPKARISRYEHDHVVPTLSTLEAMARAIGVSPAFIAGWL